MPLYTFTSLFSASRVTNQLLVADTSYLIALSDSNDDSHQSASNFHKAALASGTQFIINVIVRQEFIKWVRNIQLLKAMVTLANADATIDSRYRRILKSKAAAPSASVPLERKHIKTRVDSLHKSHVTNDDVSRLTPYLTTDIWQEVQRLEKQSAIYYVSGAGSISWDDLGVTLAKYGTDVTDSMIANFAFFAGASAIATTDVDYAQFAPDIDVYMPETVAKACAAYNPQLDNQA